MKKLTEEQKEEISKCWDGQCWRYPCSDGWHDSFWKTVIESPQWKAWQKEQSRNMTYDMPEVEELGYISQGHFQDFMKFVKENNL